MTARLTLVKRIKGGMMPELRTRVSLNLKPPQAVFAFWHLCHAEGRNEKNGNITSSWSA
jgi:hypothetical protein